jgi:hypothetical protein
MATSSPSVTLADPEESKKTNTPKNNMVYYSWLSVLVVARVRHPRETRDRFLVP